MRGNQAPFCGGEAGDRARAVVRGWFEEPAALEHYARAAASLGLWRSEEIVFESVLRHDDEILDAGCSAGRVAFGLWKKGFRKITGVDFAPGMVAEARRLAEAMEFPIRFLVEDVTNLSFPDATFDAVIFAFNGLMQIPGREHRRKALRDLARITRVGGVFVFTTHDRDLGRYRRSFACAPAQPDAAMGAGLILEPGDRVFHNPEGRIFMHWPDRAEIRADLSETGWTVVEDHLRSEIANESDAVRQFSDECRFWVAKRIR